MSLDLRVKDTVVHYVDTIVAEAGKYLGHDNAAALVDPNLRPYSAPAINRNFNPHQFLARAKETLKITENYHSAATVLSIGHHRQLTETPRLKPNLIAQISKRIRDILEVVQEVDKIRVNKNTSYYYSGLMGLGGVAFLGIGYLVPATWMKTVGKVVIVIAAVWLASSYLWHRKDQDTIKNRYEIIGKSGELIRHDLCYFDKHMELRSERVTEYKPLFNELAPQTDQPNPPSAEELKDIAYPMLPAE